MEPPERGGWPVPEPKTYARHLVKGSAIVFVALIASGFIAFLLRMLLV